MRTNRGPAAAPENRVALLCSARRLFAEQGINVPMSTIAKEAGVGQGVLYRHFPSRMDLAVAVFQENIDRVERIADAAGRAGAFDAAWAELLRLTIEDVAFVETSVASRHHERIRAADSRMGRLLSAVLTSAQEAGRADPGLTSTDLMRLLRACYGLAVTAEDGEAARDDAASLMRRLGLPGPARGRGSSADS